MSSTEFHAPNSGKVLDSALQAVGNTPLIRLDRLANASGIVCNIYGKVEFFNPGESVKDRMALKMVEEAEKEGRLVPGKSVLVEPTAGNTGAALAWIAILKGYKAILVMPQRMSPDKEIIMRGYGAEVIRAPNGKERNVALRLLETIPNAVMLDQFKNPKNALAHELTTGPELIEAIESIPGDTYRTSGKIDAFFAGCGSGGTLAGVSRAIKREHNPNLLVVACDPIGSVIARPESLNAPEQPLGLEGIGLKFVPDTVEYDSVSKWVKVQNDDGYEAALKVHRLEGLLVGGSSGGIVAGMLDYLKSPEGWETLGGVEGKNIVCMLPDGIRNYMTREWFIHSFPSIKDHQYAAQFAEALQFIEEECKGRLTLRWAETYKHPI